MKSHTDAPVATTADVSDDNFDPSLCQWETDDQWQQCYDYYIDIQWDDSRDVQERTDARLTLYGKLHVVRPDEAEDSRWWSANSNPSPTSYARRHLVTQRPMVSTSPPPSDGEDVDL